jgi:hypothetical protein
VCPIWAGETLLEPCWFDRVRLVLSVTIGCEIFGNPSDKDRSRQWWPIVTAPRWDSKSTVGNHMRVQVPPSAPYSQALLAHSPKLHRRDCQVALMPAQRHGFARARVGIEILIAPLRWPGRRVSLASRFLLPKACQSLRSSRSARRGLICCRCSLGEVFKPHTQAFDQDRIPRWRMSELPGP